MDRRIPLPARQRIDRRRLRLVRLPEESALQLPVGRANLPRQRRSLCHESLQSLELPPRSAAVERRAAAIEDLRQSDRERIHRPEDAQARRTKGRPTRCGQLPRAVGSQLDNHRRGRFAGERWIGVHANRRYRLRAQGKIAITMVAQQRHHVAHLNRRAVAAEDETGAIQSASARRQIRLGVLVSSCEVEVAVDPTLRVRMRFETG
jgi:hypothetical protein